jgi:hypothetical protein|tara:strand:+ start:106 stop:474 length:369 start_codon:yes stop_codon:yes gene_type:complete
LRDDAGGSRLPVLQRHYLLIYKFNTMKNLKFLLPMLAMIFAIGLTFATVDPEPKPEPVEQAQDYILLNGTTWVSIDEQPCETGEFTCRVQDGENGPIYEVYDERNDEEPKGSSSEDPMVIEL